jgi:hypothetical protein
VEYHGTALQRPNRALAASVIAASDQVVVFEQRRQTRFDYALQLAKSLKRKISLELYEGSEENAGQLTIE